VEVVIAYLAELAMVPLLIIGDLGMQKLPHTAAEDLLEVIMRRYEPASTLLTSNRPVDDWRQAAGRHGGDYRLARSPAPSRPRPQNVRRSWRTKVQPALRTEDITK